MMDSFRVPGTLNESRNIQRSIINANANHKFTINKMLASVCFEINTGYLEMSKRQSRISEELADVKKKVRIT